MSINKKLFKLFCSISLIMFLFSEAFAGHCVDWPEGVFVPKVNAQGQKLPDYGLYWFHVDSKIKSRESVVRACDYADPKCAAQEKNYFDPKKPTIIFIHGWVPFSVKSKGRFDFCYQYPLSSKTESPVFNTIAKWQGYNVGVFYWNQFADEFQLLFPEEAVVAVEAKIYSPNGSRGMEWKYLDQAGKVQMCTDADTDCVRPNQGIADLAFETYQKALPKSYHQELRITGQSLGTQIAIQLTAKIMQNPSLPQPTSLVLMDPFFSPDGKFTEKNNLPYSVAQYNTETVTYILQMYHKSHPASRTKFPIYVYRTSTLSYPPFGDPADALMSQVNYMRVYPAFIKGASGLTLQMDEHLSSVYIYFNFKGAPPKSELATFTLTH